MQNNKNLIILLSLFSNIYWFSRYSRFQVLWICDILVRIRIRWSLPLTYGFGTFCYRQWLTRSQNKYVFFQFFFAFSTYVLKLQSSKIKSKKNVTKKETSMFFLLYLLVNGRIWIRTKETRIQIREAQKLTDPDL